MTISINCKILKLLLNDHILDCRSDSASSSQRELTAASKHHWCGSHLFMEVRHAGNKLQVNCQNIQKSMLVSQGRKKKTFFFETTKFQCVYLTAYCTDQNLYHSSFLSFS